MWSQTGNYPAQKIFKNKSWSNIKYHPLITSTQQGGFRTVDVPTRKTVPVEYKLEASLGN